MKRYATGEVTALTGITWGQIRYAERHGHIKTGRVARPGSRYRYTAEEIARLCEWFGYPMPELEKCSK